MSKDSEMDETFKVILKLIKDKGYSDSDFKFEEGKRDITVRCEENIEDFRINPDRHQFVWAIQKELNSDKINITGRFILKQQNAKKED